MQGLSVRYQAIERIRTVDQAPRLSGVFTTRGWSHEVKVREEGRHLAKRRPSAQLELSASASIINLRHSTFQPLTSTEAFAAPSALAR
jgi:hypothetical protein